MTSVLSNSHLPFFVIVMVGPFCLLGGGEESSLYLYYSGVEATGRLGSGTSSLVDMEHACQ